MHLNAKIDSLYNSIDTIESNGRMTHNFCHHWSKAPGLGSEFLKPIARPLKELQNLTFMGDILNHKHSETPVSPLSPLHETLDSFSSLIHEFHPIVVKSPDSTTIQPLTNLDLNQTTKFHYSVSNRIDHV